MPRYEFECPEGHITEKLMRISDSDIKMVTCRVCGRGARKIISGAADVKDFSPYWDDNLSPGAEPVLVTSRRHKQELLKAQGLVEKGTDETNRRVQRQIVSERAREIKKRRREDLRNV